jgi:hypothetical protein
VRRWSSRGASGSTPDAQGAKGAIANSTGDTYTATTAGDGTYTVSGLPADSYAIEFDPTCGGTASSSYAIGFFDNETDPGDADSIVVGTGINSGNN